MTASDRALELAMIAAHAASEKQAENIVALDVSETLVITDIFLLCSESEGFGLPVLEAMASGLPVISRELAAVREVAGDAIRYVPGTDPDAYATAAVTVLRDAELRRSMRQQGLERADRFRWARTAELTQRVYEELLAVRTVPGPSKPAG